jgi:hypothetical protein
MKRERIPESRPQVMSTSPGTWARRRGPTSSILSSIVIIAEIGNAANKPFAANDPLATENRE